MKTLQHSVRLLLAPLLAVSFTMPAVAVCASAPMQGDSGADSALAVTDLEKLKKKVELLARSAGGTVGVAAIHLESGQELLVHGDELFPMASTYKLPIAIQVLHLVDRGELDLQKKVKIKRSDLHPGSGELSRHYDDLDITLSVSELFELMMVISDNSATDLMMELAGGSAEVTRRVRELEVKGLRVDRPTVQLIADWLGVDDLPAPSRFDLRAFGERAQAVKREVRERAAAQFADDPRDCATPRAFVHLFEKLWKGDALSADSRRLLLDIMYKCKTGAGRIKGRLPPGTPVAHKTGTIGGTANDVGVIDLPNGRGHVAVVVLTKKSARDLRVREESIALISRAIFDYFSQVGG